VIITGLRADARVAGSIIVDIDGVRVASLPPEMVRELRLEVGAELAPADHDRLVRACLVEGARRVALRLLAARPRAMEDLRRKLRERGHEPGVIAETLGRLQASGLLDDEQFAQHFVRVRATRGHGPARLVHDLLSRGVDRRVAEQAVREVSLAEGVDNAAAMRQLAEKRAVQLMSLPVPKRRRRLLIFLARRGFRGREVREMVAHLVG